MKVKSLSSLIVAQFAVILLPLVAVLVYETGAEVRRAADLSLAMVLHRQAIEAKDSFAVFLNGAVDAVETGRLAAAAGAALEQTSARLALLRQNDPAPAQALDGLLLKTQTLANEVRRDPSLPALTRLQSPMAAVRLHLEDATQARQADMDRVVEQAIADAAQTERWLLVLAAVLLVLTGGFIVRMVRGLSQPLRLAVELADQIASGEKCDGFTFDTRQDIGNLLGSLQRMHASLRGFEHDVHKHREGLELKIRELARSEHILAQAQRTARLGNWQWSPEARAGMWSDELVRIVGLGAEATKPSMRAFLRALPAGERRALTLQWRSLIAGENHATLEHKVGHAEGEDRTVHHQMAAQRDGAGRLLNLVGTVQDITERKRNEEERVRLAMIDGLTGLANRRSFNQHLGNALARSKRHCTGLATMFIDLDRFKRINDTLGHAAGDALLREAATRLQGCVRETDAVAPVEPETGNLVARLGGDEFIVLLRDVLTSRDAATIAQRMVAALSRPFEVEGHELVVTASIGIAMFPSDGSDCESLIKAADAAMYESKKLGRNTFQFFTQEMTPLALERLTLEGELRAALRQQEFVLHFQPKVDIRTGAIFGVEALIRWQHPLRGLTPPGQFIALAEELGLIVAIGDWVLEEACRQVAQWRREGLGEVSVAINLASPSFRKPGLVSDLTGLVTRHEVAPTQLQLEATESMLMESAGTTLRTLQELHEFGVKLSIDDFGTGYSSLSYLRRFPIDQLKIDRSFVSAMTENADDAAIAGAIISLGRNMKREIVAEGVETLEQARVLQSLGCDIMQGFLFSRPVPAHEMGLLLRRKNPFSWVVAEPALTAA